MQVELNIQEKEDKLFYFYHNWRAGQDNKIHSATCAFCCYGTGRNLREAPKRGKNGVWIGPFSSLDLCRDYISNKLEIPIPENCTRCIVK